MVLDLSVFRRFSWGFFFIVDGGTGECCRLAFPLLRCLVATVAILVVMLVSHGGLGFSVSLGLCAVFTNGASFVCASSTFSTFSEDFSSSLCSVLMQSIAPTNVEGITVVSSM